MSIVFCRLGMLCLSHKIFLVLFLSGYFRNICTHSFIAGKKRPYHCYYPPQTLQTIPHHAVEHPQRQHWTRQLVSGQTVPHALWCFLWWGMDGLLGNVVKCTANMEWRVPYPLPKNICRRRQYRHVVWGRLLVIQTHIDGKWVAHV